MNDDLIAFFKARMAEVEAAARLDEDAPEGAHRYADIDKWGEPLSWLMTSDRVLRDVEADRKLIAAYEEHSEYSDPWIGLDIAIRIRASRFSGHPDYEEAWAP